MSEIIVDKTDEIMGLGLKVDELAAKLDNHLYQLFREAKDISKDYNDKWVIPEKFKLQLKEALKVESELAQCTVEWLNARKRTT